MIKNAWYLERKKIPIEKEIFRLIIIGCFLYTMVSSIMFLVQYFDQKNWSELIQQNRNLFGKHIIESGEANGIVKLVYLSRFWGSIGLMILLQISTYIYTKKTKHGYLFPFMWITLIVGMIIIDITLIKSDVLFYIWKLIPLLFLLWPLGYQGKEIYLHRRNLNQAYYLKIKKGEL